MLPALGGRAGKRSHRPTFENLFRAGIHRLQSEISIVAAITIDRKRFLRIVNPPFSNISVNEIDAEHLSTPSQTASEGMDAKHISTPIQYRQLLWVSPPFHFVLHSSLFYVCLHIRRASFRCLNLYQVVYILQVFSASSAVADSFRVFLPAACQDS